MEYDLLKDIKWTLVNGVHGVPSNCCLCYSSY